MVKCVNFPLQKKQKGLTNDVCQICLVIGIRTADHRLAALHRITPLVNGMRETDADCQSIKNRPYRVRHERKVNFEIRKNAQIDSDLESTGAFFRKKYGRNVLKTTAFCLIIHFGKRITKLACLRKDIKKKCIGEYCRQIIVRQGSVIASDTIKEFWMDKMRGIDCVIIVF